MKVQGRTKRGRAHALLGVMIALVCACLTAPAVGQGNGQGQGTTCVQESLDCAADGLDGGPGICSSFNSCYVTATESVYYTVDDRRFDCDGLDCAQAQVRLNDYCCPRIDADAGANRPVQYSDGCVIGHAGASTGSLALLALVSLLGLRRRHVS
jgi:MYXO-CTERM domain-containing protein